MDKFHILHKITDMKRFENVLMLPVMLGVLFLVFFIEAGAQQGFGPCNTDYMQVIGEGENADLDSFSYDALYRLAAAYEAMRRDREALGILDMAYLRDSTQNYLLSDLARVSLSLGRAGDAASYLERAVGRDTSDIYIILQLADTYYAGERYADASGVYAYLLERDPTNPRLWYQSAQCLRALGMEDAALAGYILAMKYNPENKVIALRYLSLVMASVNIGELIPSAVAVCDTALKYNEGDASLLRVKGQLDFRLKDYAAADSVFGVLLAKGDSSFITLKYGGLSGQLLGRRDRAADLLGKAYLIDSADFTVVVSLASAYSGLKRFSESELLLAKADTLLMPKKENIYSLTVGRGNLYYSMGDIDRACEYYYKVYLMNPDDMEPLAFIARLRPSWNMATEAGRQKKLFLVYTLLEACFAKGLPVPSSSSHRTELGHYIDDAFFKGDGYLPMVSPLGERAAVSIGTLRDLHQKL